MAERRMEDCCGSFPMLGVVGQNIIPKRWLGQRVR